MAYQKDMRPKPKAQALPAWVLQRERKSGEVRKHVLAYMALFSIVFSPNPNE